MLARSSVVARSVLRSVATAQQRTLAGVPLAVEDSGDFAVFPRQQSGLNYAVNWSLADDNVTPRGAVYRNPKVEELLLQSGITQKDGGLAVELPTGKSRLCATDNVRGFETMDVDEFEARLEQLTDAFSNSEALFVEDAALGSQRESELRVRVITDSAPFAAFVRSALERVPVRDPNTTPRPLVVYALTQGNGGFSVSDYNPTTGKGVLAISGPVSVADFGTQLWRLASTMMLAGTFKTVPAGGVRVQAARAGGYLRVPDAHYVGAAAPVDLLPLFADAYTSEKGSTLVVPTAGGAAGSPFAAHAVVWGSSGLSRLWGGAVGKNVKAGRGSVFVQGLVSTPSTQANLAPHPKRVVLLSDDAAATASDSSSVAAAAGIDAIVSKLSLTPAAAEKLAARVKTHNTEFVQVGRAGLDKAISL